MNDKDVKLGIAPINWTNDDLPELGGEISFEQCISEMALAGYTGCEVGTKFPVDNPEKLRHMLEVRGLSICNQWFSMFLTSESLSWNVEKLHQHASFLQSMGADIIGASEQTGSIQGKQVPLFGGEKPSLDRDGWKKLCQGCNELGKIAREEYGMSFCYHYHLGTSIETRNEMIQLMEGTDPDCLFALYDTGHAFSAGDDVLSLLEEIKDRVRHVHVKDVRVEVLLEIREKKLSFLQGVRKGLFTVPGDAGSIDYSGVFKILDSIKYKGWIVVEAEQDPSQANPYEYAKQGREFIRKTAGI